MNKKPTFFVNTKEKLKSQIKKNNVSLLPSIDKGIYNISINEGLACSDIFPCPDCGKNFSRKSNLKVRIPLYHHGVGVLQAGLRVRSDPGRLLGAIKFFLVGSR